MSSGPQEGPAERGHVKKRQKVSKGRIFGRTDFSRIFIFEPPDFFADFLAGFFLLIFVGKSARKNPPGKSPAKSSKIYTTKILQHISADCPGQKIVKKCQKYFRHFSTFFARRAKQNFKNRQKMAKMFSTLFDNFRAAPVFRPLLGGSEISLVKLKFLFCPFCR